MRKWGKDAEAEEQGMEMAKKRRTGVKFRGEESFGGAHGTLYGKLNVTLFSMGSVL